MARIDKNSISGRLRTMEVGDVQVFPVEKLQYIYATCSVFAKTIKKRYTTSYDSEAVTVRRIA